MPRTKISDLRVMVFGTFDIVHEGHLHLFKQAKALGQNAKLIVSIARDKNVLKIKGRLPRKTELLRKHQVQKIAEVDRVVLGGVHDHIPHIVRIAPDIIALGYDQEAYVKGLRKDLLASGLSTKIVRLKPYKPKIYKTSLIQK